MRVSFLLLILFCSFQAIAESIVMLGYRMDGLVEQGFRDGVISELPETRFYTYGSGENIDVFKSQMEASKRFDAQLIFTNGLIPTKELLKDKSLPHVVFVSILYPFENEQFDGVNFSNSSGIRTNIPVRKLLLAMKDIVDYKKLGILKTEDNRNYRYSISEIEKLKGELRCETVELDAADLFELNSLLAEHRPDAIYIPAHGSVNRLIFDIVKAHNIPTIAENREDVKSRSALLSLVVDRYRAGRLAAKKAVSILKGGPTENLTIDAIEHTMFVVNLKTASRLGVQVPMTYLIIADEIIR